MLPWRNALEEFQVGGERGYGWGRLELDVDRMVDLGQSYARMFLDIQCTAEDDARPTVTLAPGQPLLAHTVAHGLQADGEVEPLVGRAWHGQRGAGQAVSLTDVCYVPGARLLGSQPQSFTWTTAQIWRAV